MGAARARHGVLSALALIFKALVLLLTLLTPVLGVWCASSLAAYRNGPIWLAVAAGALLFPVLPVLWELLARSRHARRLARRATRGVAKRPAPILTIGDRLILRTLALNVLFLVLLLATYPRVAFAALAARGDWMLEGSRSASAPRVRRALFRAANGLEWLYLATHDNPFRKFLKVDLTPSPSTEPIPSAAPIPSPPPTAGTSPSASAAAAAAATASAAPAASVAPGASAAEARPSWPSPASLHPAVREIPAEAERSIASVAHYIVAREPDPVLRVKALHDYVADRVSYDVESYRAKVYPPQDAETVFRTRKSVCAGYAELLAALGKAAGAEIAIVVGDARSATSDLTGEGHAWNAARIDGRWYLLDATWDSGFVNGAEYTARYTSDYLFTPPAVFGVDHFPDNAEWQLRASPLSRGDFLRQPALRPRFFAQGLELLDPTRSQVTAHGSLDLTIGNPRGAWLSAVFESTQDQRCRFERGNLSRFHCEFPRGGRYNVQLFVNEKEFGSYEYAGNLEVNNAQ